MERTERLREEGIVREAENSKREHFPKTTVQERTRDCKEGEEAHETRFRGAKGRVHQQVTYLPVKCTMGLFWPDSIGSFLMLAFHQKAVMRWETQNIVQKSKLCSREQPRRESRQSGRSEDSFKDIFVYGSVGYCGSLILIVIPAEG